MRKLFFSLSFLVACVGKAPPGGGDDSTAGDDAPPPDTTNQRVTGKTLDYFAAATPMPDAIVSSDGIVPAKMTTSIADGSYAVVDVPPGSKVFFSVEHASYRPTRNVVISVADVEVTQDLYVMSIADINRQYATDGKAPTAGKAFVIAELQRNNGQPAAGVPLTDVKLLDAAGQPVPGVIGPFTIGAVGDVTPASTQTELQNGKVRVAFLDVPAGTFKLDLTVLNGQGQPQTITSSLTTTTNGATLHLVGGAGGGGAGGGAVTNPTFAADIHPRLQKAASGGVGCGNCHTAAGQGAVLVLDGAASAVLDALKAKVGLIDLATPANSLLLTKPLYEPAPPQNHPNATFLDLNDADYKLISLWITQGAKL